MRTPVLTFSVIFSFLLGSLACSGGFAHAVDSQDVLASQAFTTDAVASPDEEITPLGPGALIDSEQNTIDIFKQAAPAVVFVTQSQVVRDFYMRATEVPAGAGTGFVWDDRGHIVTNFHVVTSNRGTPKLSVTLQDQRSYPATIVGVEPRKDIAVLHIDAPPELLHPIHQSVSGSSLITGQKAVAIGNPFGLDHTLTTGVISALGREVMGIGRVTIRDMIQTDAAINPGNSGGPLLNSQGQLIGMNTMIYSQSGSSAGIGFAVPASTIQRIVPQIIRTGRAEQAGLGVNILDDRIARRNRIEGVIIRAVQPDSPAAEAGLRGLQETSAGIDIGDVIVAIDDEAIKNYDDLYNALDGHRAGDKVVVSVRRDGEVVKVPLALTLLD